MAQLPESIAVEVLTPGELRRDRILVGLTFRIGPREYFSTLLGLTDEAGCVKIERRALERDFAENRRAFPMDYKLPIAECDNAVVDISDGREFESRRGEVLKSSLLSDGARAMWTDARNPGIWASPTPVRVDGSAVSVTIVARKIGVP